MEVKIGTLTGAYATAMHLRMIPTILLYIPPWNIIDGDKVKAKSKKGKDGYKTYDLIKMVIHLISHETVHLVLDEFINYFFSHCLDNTPFEDIQMEMSGTQPL